MIVQRGDLWWADLGQLPRLGTCRPRGTGLPSVSVIDVSQISAVDKRFLGERIGQLPPHLMSDVEEGVKLVLGL